ncbi:MAG: hypothetical protein K9L60_12830 [Methylovulum sp.]|jgi:hypothetical protein|nr:hypothetical protein [Methylovulum sp.]MCF7999876.1 hypothetical protein [Methylovulum sp.]
MKKLATLLIILSCGVLVACSNGQKINGHTTKTAYKSVKMLKNRLVPENRIEFEVAFWAIRDANKEDSKFLELVDGKKPEEIISLGKEIYQQRRDAGFKEYTQYSSWEEMITKFGRERIDQDNRKSSKKEDTKDKDNDVLYKL